MENNIMDKECFAEMWDEIETPGQEVKNYHKMVKDGDDSQIDYDIVGGLTKNTKGFDYIA